VIELPEGASSKCLAAPVALRAPVPSTRAQAEVPSARRADTPMQLALVDVTARDWRDCRAHGGVADRREPAPAFVALALPPLLPRIRPGSGITRRGGTRSSPPGDG